MLQLMPIYCHAPYVSSLLSLSAPPNTTLLVIWFALALFSREKSVDLLPFGRLSMRVAFNKTMAFQDLQSF
jgi:hypothetical protein